MIWPLPKIAFVLLTTVVLSACGSSPDASSKAQNETDGAPDWMSYQRDAEYGVFFQEDLQVPTRDDSFISCDLLRPAINNQPADGQFPGIVYNFHGYADSRKTSDRSHAGFYAERGYNVLLCTVRGLGGSPGRIDPFSPQEAQDNYDMVEWLAEQPYSTGAIGQTGYSWGGWTTYRVAELQPPHLVTIAPQSSFAEAYHDIIYLGGARGFDIRVWLLGFIQSTNTEATPPEQQSAMGPRLTELGQEWDAHPFYDEYWQARRVNHDALRDSGIPILSWGSWRDIYQRGMPRNQAQLNAQQWLVMDTASHLNLEDLAQAPPLPLNTLGWFDYWLKGIESAALPSSAVVSAELPVGEEPRWVEFEQWPPSTVKAKRWHLTSGALLTGSLDETAAAANQSQYLAHNADGELTFWNISFRPESEQVVLYDTIRSNDRLEFATKPFASDTLMLGSVKAHIEASLIGTDTTFVLRLFNRAPDGSQELIGTGWRKASHSQDHSQAVTITSGERFSRTIEIWPSHWRFKAGYQLVLSFSGSDIPRIYPENGTGQVTIFTGEGGSYIDVPLLMSDAD